ncbi:hypothetical protein SPFM20_00090 [Salmonella phage SPFM20]|nr:hypothetical protein SPFM20_00090 [Salmonella phage SPFM20]
MRYYYETFVQRPDTKTLASIAMYYGMEIPNRDELSVEKICSKDFRAGDCPGGWWGAVDRHNGDALWLRVVDISFNGRVAIVHRPGDKINLNDKPFWCNARKLLKKQCDEFSGFQGSINGSIPAYTRTLFTVLLMAVVVGLRISKARAIVEISKMKCNNVNRHLAKVVRIWLL